MSYDNELMKAQHEAYQEQKDIKCHYCGKALDDCEILDITNKDDIACYPCRKDNDDSQG